MNKGALRLTFGDYNSIEDVDYLVENLVRIVEMRIPKRLFSYMNLKKTLP